MKTDAFYYGMLMWLLSLSSTPQLRLSLTPSENRALGREPGSPHEGPRADLYLTSHLVLPSGPRLPRASPWEAVLIRLFDSILCFLLVYTSVFLKTILVAALEFTIHVFK